MALATQCPHCLTIFRVASDQLKLRGGLVRCGSCRSLQRQRIPGRAQRRRRPLPAGAGQQGPGRDGHTGVCAGIFAFIRPDRPRK
jgi:predicted Zn finger-like uncharacterized protein